MRTGVVSCGLAMAVVVATACTTLKQGDDAAVASGVTFLPVAPCNSESDYRAGAGSTVQIVSEPLSAYVPNCVKIKAFETVTFEGSPEHPLLGTSQPNTNSGSPISVQPTTSNVTLTFVLAGFYSFECLCEENMSGVIWVTPP